ncbi:site-specific DNA-methyltransferase, partial [Campylobacter lari]|nr:site-specific DNA-methyltransferase [Campylobacter lari]
IFSKKTLVFKLNDFLNFLDLRSLGGSFTSYANKIGLANKTKSLLKTNNEVVLNFAFKDGVIKGGQSKDDETQNEIFFNEILARDEIDVLFDKKALQNFELIGENKNLQEYLKDNPNLLIKGNNLLALHSLKKLYANKVKLIYIDPPYNTGNDSFKYNDKFNHSTWLTFMKNRLEVAREFLSDDGVIFVQCDDNEQAYLKVLMDEIFGRDNFVNILTIKTKIGGVSGSSEGKSIKDATEFINVFAKKKEDLELNKVYIKTPLINYIQKYKADGKSWKYTSIITKLDGKKEFFKTDDFTLYTYDVFESQSISEFAKRNHYTEEEVYKNFTHKIFRTTNAQSSIRAKVLKETIDLKNAIVSIEYTPQKGKNREQKIEIFYKDKKRNMLMFLADYVEFNENNPIYLEGINTLWSDIQYNNLASEGNCDFTNAKKPEALLQRIIEISTDENDLVMDFFAGSGTTLAVAHKMKRKWIGIEQMDYIETITKERLKKVIEGEQGGISKAVNWQGGGSFVYAELMPLNAIYKEKIQNLNNEKELDNIYQELKTKAFLDYRVDIQDILKDKDFKELSLEDKKQILNLALDSNMDYVLYGDIKDKDYDISKETIKLNEIFYGDENV